MPSWVIRVKPESGGKKRAISSYDEVGAKEIELKRIRRDAELAEYHSRYKLKASEIKQGGLILDVGCGEDLDIIGFTKNGTRVIGIDISKAMLDACKRAHTEKGIDSPDLVLGDAERLPFKNEAFDAVHSRDLSSFNTLNVGGASATSDPLTVLREMKRVSKTKGKILTMLPVHDGAGCNFKPSCEEELKYMYRHAQIPFQGVFYLSCSANSGNQWLERLLKRLRVRVAERSDFIVSIGEKD